MYPYHNKIKQRINNGELVGFEFVEDWPKIGSCLLLRFNTLPALRPVRPHRYAEYLPILKVWAEGKFGAAAEQETSGRKLADIEPGETFHLGEHEFIVLEHCDGETAVICKDILKNMTFGGNNNYNGSAVDDACIAFGDEIAGIVGEENLMEHIVDLTSDDGLDDYGDISRRVSLLTTAQYRRWVKILDRHNPNKWWWLATPYSTKAHENDRWVKCVAPSGHIRHDNYGIGGYGVRPFCILKSSIFVS